METKKILFLSEYLEMIKSYFKNVTDNIKEAGNERLSYHLKLYVDHQKVLMKIHISIYGVVTKKLWLVKKQMKLLKNFLNHFLPTTKKP